MKTKPTKAMQRRKFLGTSTLAAAGLTLGAGQLFAGPAILRQTGDSASAACT